MYLVATVAALAGLLFGYDTGIISGAMLFLKNSFAMTDAQLGWVVAAVPLGALSGAVFCGWLSDLVGRKLILIVTAILYVIGSILSAVSISIDMLIVSRFVLGIAVGLGSYSAPMYIAEISKSANRGGLVTINQLAITVGIMLSYLIDWVFSYQGQWRYMLGCGFIPALILFLCVISLPESPRWLVTKGKLEKAKELLREIHGKSAKEEFQEICAVAQQKMMSLSQVLSSSFMRVLLLGVMVSILTQAVGINAIIYYAPKIFQTAGLSQATGSILATSGIGMINVLFTFVAIKYLDRWGRRPMLLLGVAGIIFSLTVISSAFGYHVASMGLAWAIIICFGLFIACQAVGTGPACWLIPSEIFPTEARGVGMSISVAANWATNFVVAFFFPLVLNHVGPSWTFAIFLFIAVIAFLLFYAFVPETKGVSLEQIERNIYVGKPLRKLGQQ